MTRCSTWYRRKSRSAPVLRWLAALSAVIALLAWPADLAARHQAGPLLLATTVLAQRSILDMDEEEEAPDAERADEAEPSDAAEKPEPGEM